MGLIGDDPKKKTILVYGELFIRFDPYLASKKSPADLRPLSFQPGHYGKDVLSIPSHSYTLLSLLHAVQTSSPLSSPTAGTPIPSS
jgi:hypothetical protein